ncbi:sentan isoform X2 [Pelodiscus sinensis]|uniref:sentan isoform X2 n=1 Tax=Pelodiscus sinensis TaxID=13735 RepID=UPI003F6D409F
MCGCTASSPNSALSSRNQPAAALTQKATSAAANMPKGKPISKQLAAVKALGKGSDLEKAFATVALVYNNSADPEGKLSNAETKTLLQTQFVNFIQGQESKPKHQELMSALEEGQDNKMDFEDFVILLLSLVLMSDLLQEIRNVRPTK